MFLTKMIANLIMQLPEAFEEHVEIWLQSRETMLLEKQLKYDQCG